jgi:PmbA protein
MNSKEKAIEILDRLMRLKPDGAEVYLRVSEAFHVEVRDQMVEALDASKSHGIGVRLLLGQKMGFSFTSDISEESIENLIKTLFDNTRNIAEDRYVALPERDSGDYPSPSIYDDEIEGLTEEERIRNAAILEKAAFDYDRRIKKVRKASFSIVIYETSIMNSRGIQLSYKGTSSSVSIMAVAEDEGDSQMAWDYSASPLLDRLDIEGVGRRAADKAVGMLGARRISSARVSVVLDSSVATDFLGVLAPALSSDAVQKGRSLFAGKIGQKVANSLITIIDDGLLSEGVATAPADDEGVPMRRKILVDKGELKGFLHNTYTAKKDGAQSTGNCVRGGFRGVPGVGITNIYIEKGDISKNLLIKDIKRGFYITEAMGVHTANPISGDFSIGVSGLWIEDGGYAYPVREAVISGNIIDLMKKIDGIADDIRFYGRIGSPSLRVQDIDISGG